MHTHHESISQLSNFAILKKVSLLQAIQLEQDDSENRNLSDMELTLDSEDEDNETDLDAPPLQGPRITFTIDTDIAIDICT